MPKVFISATSHDLKSYREAVAAWAEQKGYTPVVQGDFAPKEDYHTICTMLRDEIALCDAVIHLAGFYYGFEPTDGPKDNRRRSYTQLEFEIFRVFGRKIYLFLATNDCAFDNPVASQSEEFRKLQLAHRDRIKNEYSSFRNSFKSQEDLISQLEKLPPITNAVCNPRNLPFGSLGNLFKGREAIIEKIHNNLTTIPSFMIALLGKQIIHGLGGIGKTRAAIEYALRYASNYTAVLFVTADNKENFQRNLAALCGTMVLNLPEKKSKEHDEQFSGVINWLREHTGWLLIIDNADSIEVAQAVKFEVNNLNTGNVLITSRVSDWGAGFEAFELDVLDEQTSIAFLMQRTDNNRRKLTSDSDDIRQLCKELGGLPLALEQTAAFINAHSTSYVDYYNRWKAQEAKVLEWYDEFAMEYPKSIAITWQTSVDQLSDHGKNLLNVLCWLSPDPIPRVMMEKLSSPDGEAQIDVEQGLSELVRYSLVQWDDQKENLIIHRLVEKITQYRLPSDQRHRWLKRAIQMVNDYVVVDPNDDRTVNPICEPIESHVMSILSFASGGELAELTVRLTNIYGGYFISKSQWAQAEPLVRRTLEVMEKRLGSDHPDLIMHVANLISLLRSTKRLHDAEKLAGRAIEINEKVFKPDHPNVAMSKSDWAQVLHDMGRLDEAEPVMRQLLDFYERSFKVTPTPGITEGLSAALNNLAELLHDKRLLVESEELKRRALAIAEINNDPNEPRIANYLFNLSLLLKETSRWDEAEQLMSRALEIMENWYGVNHRRCTSYLQHLSEILMITRQFQKAEIMIRRTILILEKSLGFDHPDVAGALYNLARAVRDSNRPNEAEEHCARSLLILLVFQHRTGQIHSNFERTINLYTGLALRLGWSTNKIQDRVNEINALAQKMK